MAFNLKRGVKRINRYLSKHQPAILAGTACVGVVVTAVVTARCHSRGEEILYEAECDLDDIFDDCDNDKISEEECDRRVKNTKIRCAKALGWAYAPAVISGGLTITSIILSHKAHMRTEAVLTTALNGATALLGDYKDEVKKVLKPKQRDEIEHNVAKRQVERHPVPSEDVIYSSGLGNQLMLIEKTHIYVRISEDNLNKILDNKIKPMAKDEGYASYNDLEWELCRFQSGDGENWIWEDRMFEHGEELKARVDYTNYENPRTGERESVGIVRFNIDPIFRQDTRPSAMYY